MNENILNGNQLIELGTMIDGKLVEWKTTLPIYLVIDANPEYFRKLDEDLFFRNNIAGGEEFVPSDDEITLNFKKCKFLVRNSEK